VLRRAARVATHDFGAGVGLLLEVGLPAIESRVVELSDRLAAGLQELGATVLSPRAGNERSAILTFSCGENRALYRALTDAGIVVRPRLGGIRLAPHFYNDADDVARVLDAVRVFRAA